MTTIARPASDVAALRRLLDGEHAEMRDRVREWLSQPGNIPTADRPLDEYRDQVLAWAKELADDGQTATGFPVEYGGEGAVGALDRRVRDDGLRRPLAAGQDRRPVRPVRRRRPAPRDREAPRALPARDHLARAARLLRDDRDRPRLQRAGARDDRDLRPRVARVRRRHADRRRPQGLHRQRRAPRPDGRRLRPADRRRRGARRARAARADPRRAGRAAAPACASRTAARSSGSTASTTAACTSTTCACRATRCSTATRRSAPRASTRARSRTRRSASSRCSAR